MLLINLGLKTRLINKKNDNMIVYKRLLKIDDIKNLDKEEELIYYQDDNIAYVINMVSDNYVVRRKKIFNNQMTDERFLKTPHQIIKMIE